MGFLLIIVAAALLLESKPAAATATTGIPIPGLPYSATGAVVPGGQTSSGSYSGAVAGTSGYSATDPTGATAGGFVDYNGAPLDQSSIPTVGSDYQPDYSYSTPEGTSLGGDPGE